MSANPREQFLLSTVRWYFSRRHSGRFNRVGLEMAIRELRDERGESQKLYWGGRIRTVER